jgi:hypothetical protein
VLFRYVYESCLGTGGMRIVLTLICRLARPVRTLGSGMISYCVNTTVQFFFYGFNQRSDCQFI